MSVSLAFIRISSRLLMLSMVPLACGTIIDLFSPEMQSGATPRASSNLNHFCLVVDGSIDEIVAPGRTLHAPDDGYESPHLAASARRR